MALEQRFAEGWPLLRAVRVALDSDLAPAEAVACLAGEQRPFALVGEWLGGLAVLGSDPVRVAGVDEDPFAVIASQPELGRGDEVLVGGGWVGWLGYGLGGLVERLPPAPPAPVPLPPFSLAFYDHVVVHDGERWWFEALWSDARDAALRARLAMWRARLRTLPGLSDGGNGSASLPAGAVPSRFALAGNGASGHLEAVANCRRRIAAGELYEANLCVRLEARFDGDPLALFARALPAATPRFGAFVDGVVSLSPERFLRRRGRDVWTEPIKGTRPRTGAESDRRAAFQELLSSEKDAAEHVMIVDLMRNDLGRVCAYGSVRAQEPRVEAHAGVWHLVSTVSGQLRDGVDDGELLRASFPPGSVTGAPKIQAMKVIATLEATRREVYTGAIGIATPVAGLDLNVAIRTFEVSGNAIWLGVGGAVVADSDPERELDEALAKAAGPIAAIRGQVAPAPGRVIRPMVRPLVGGHEVARRALAYGERPDPGLGVFETVHVEHGRPLRLEAHLARLEASLRTLYGAPLPRTVLAGTRAAAAEHADLARARMRVLADPDGSVRISVSAAAPRATDGPAMLVPFALPGGLGAHKWRDRRLLEAVAGAAGGGVPLLVDTDGAVLEASYANVWIVEGEAMLTPPVDGRILPGTARGALLAGEAGAREEAFDLARLAGAEEVFLTSSISGRHLARLGPAPSPLGTPMGRSGSGRVHRAAPL